MIQYIRTPLELFRAGSDKRQQILHLLCAQLVTECRHYAGFAISFAALRNHPDDETVGQFLIALLVSPVVGRYSRLKLY